MRLGLLHSLHSKLILGFAYLLAAILIRVKRHSLQLSWHSSLEVPSRLSLLVAPSDERSRACLMIHGLVVVEVGKYLIELSLHLLYLCILLSFLHLFIISTIGLLRYLSDLLSIHMALSLLLYLSFFLKSLLLTLLAEELRHILELF